MLTLSSLLALMPLLTVVSIPLSPYRQYAPNPSKIAEQLLSQSLKQYQARQSKVTSKSWQGKLTVDTISGGHSRAVYSVAFSPNAQTLASGSGDRTVKVWSLSARRLLHTFTGHSNWVSSVAFSPDGQILASGSGDRTIKLWNLRTGKLIRSLSEQGGITAIAISPDGKTR